jgi:hypothetical protein
MIFELLAYGTIEFWGALFFIAAIFLYNTYQEKLGYSTLTVVGTVVALFCLTNLPILKFFRSLTVLNYVEYVGGYLLVGVVYMTLKWVYNTYEIKSLYNTYRENFLKDYDYNSFPTLESVTQFILANPTLPVPGSKGFKNSSRSFEVYNEIVDSFKSNFVRELHSLGYNDNYCVADLPPLIRNHKQELVFWAAYWPASLFFTLLGNPLRHVINFCINMLTKPLNAISVKMFKDFNELT